MSADSRQEVVERLRRHYERAGRIYRRKLVEQLCGVCGYEEKYTIKVLCGNRPGPRGMQRGGPHPLYGQTEKEVVKELWKLADYPCGKRLVAILPLWLPSYEKRYGELDVQVHDNIEQISSATLDRMLATDRAKAQLHRGGTKPGRLLRTQIPVRCESWNVDRPGYLEADTVDHCGNTTAGSYMHSVTFTDIYSGWVEQAAVWNKGAAGVLKRTKEIEAEIPFEILGFDSDNGGEFLNYHLFRYFRDRRAPVMFTRSREYHKNDNAHVEQKNWSKVRQLLGYARFENPELVELVHGLYRGEWRLLQNFFQPVMKLVEKERRGSRIYKRYDKPQTPAQRLLAWKGLSKKKRAWIEEMQTTLDPILLTEAVNRKSQSIRRILKEGNKHAAA